MNIKLTANANGSITPTESFFPLGESNIFDIDVKSILTDKMISILKSQVNKTCSDTDNYFTYGHFSKDKDVNNVIKTELLPQANITIAKGEGINFGPCLMCKSDNCSIGKFILPTDKLINNVVNDSYTFICSIKTNINLKLQILTNTENVCSELDINKSLDWQTIEMNFNCSDVNSITKFMVCVSNTENNVDVPAIILLDNIELFNFSSFISNTKNTNICAKIDIIYPSQVYSLSNKKESIDYVLKWDLDNLILSLLSETITITDISNSVLCKFILYNKLKEKTTSIGNTYYSPDKEILYESEPFMLSGYIKSHTERR